jgi:hypothetical protein
MDKRATFIISSLTLLLGIGIGRITAPSAKPINTPITDTAHNSSTVSAQSPDTAGALTAAAKTVFANKSSQQVAITTPDAPPVKEPAAVNRNNTYDGSAEGAAKDYPNEITAEEIDRVLPAPFNDSFKHAHGFLREKYKDFVANTLPNDWDTRMQNKISDFIFSNPYSKFINVESLMCKSGLCEIRLFETKQGTFSAILSEMALQDWWDVGGYHASGNAVADGRTAYHVLLPRK